VTPVKYMGYFESSRSPFHTTVLSPNERCERANFIPGGVSSGSFGKSLLVYKWTHFFFLPQYGLSGKTKDISFSL
jgi:hypothetical protein